MATESHTVEGICCSQPLLVTILAHLLGGLHLLTITVCTSPCKAVEADGGGCMKQSCNATYPLL